MTYHSRLHLLQHTIQESLCDAILIDDKTDLYYLTGLELSAGTLLVHAKGAELFVDGRYLEMCQKHSPFPVTLIDPASLPTQLMKPDYAHIRRLAFDSSKTTYKQHDKFSNALQAVAKNKSLTLIPLDEPLKLQRTIKDAHEIQALRDAAILGSQGFDFVCTLMREGITEQECALELEIFWKRHGSKGLAFDPIIAFGPNCSMPHYRAGHAKLKLGDCILIDIGVIFKHYHSDMTRMAFYGKPDTRLLAVHAIVQKAQEAALNLCRPGTSLGALDAAARDLIASHGYGPQFSHSLGHGVGLDIHEYPTIKNAPPFNTAILVPGMVITIEPGIYLPGIGGVRIENTIVITPDGFEDLTNRSTNPVFINCEN